MFVPYVADIYGYTAAQSALLLTYIGVVAVITQGVLVGRLSARYSPVRLSLFGTGLLVVGVGAIPASRAIGSVLPDLTALVPFLTADLLGLLLVLTLLPLGNGILSVTLTALVSQQASAALQGSAFGITQGAGSLARTVGPPVMGGLYFAVGYWSPFVVGSVLLLPVLWLVSRLGVTQEAYEPGRRTRATLDRDCCQRLYPTSLTLTGSLIEGGACPWTLPRTVRVRGVSPTWRHCPGLQAY